MAMILLLLFFIWPIRSIDTIKNYCKLWDHQIVIKDKKMYIDGGNMVLTPANINGNSNGTEYYGINSNIVVCNLNHDFDWRYWDFPSTGFAQYPKTVLTLGFDVVPILQRGALFATDSSDNRIFLFGGSVSYLNTSAEGFRDPQSSASPLWSFDTTTLSWTEYNAQTVFGSAVDVPNAGAWVNAPELGLGFYIDGQIDKGSSQSNVALGNDSYLVSGTVVINLNDQTGRNFSTSSSNYSQPSTRGSAAWLPNVGTYGIVVQLGGIRQSFQNDSDLVNGTVVSLEYVNILDVATVYNSTPDSVEWYQQQTTGRIPEPRMDFCVVAASAADNSSHQLYIYGGRNGTVFFDDIYVLSMPTFTWSKTFQGGTPRAFHSCGIASGSRLITSGGTNDTRFNRGCDWESVGLGIMNMNTNTWQSYFNTTYEMYQVPQNISHEIGGGPLGGATVKQPDAGFNDSRVATLFTQRSLVNSSIARNTTGTDNGPPIPSTHKLSSGAMAGIVTGSIIGALLLAAGIALYAFPPLRFRVRFEKIHPSDDRRPRINQEQSAGTRTVDNWSTTNPGSPHRLSWSIRNSHVHEQSDSRENGDEKGVSEHVSDQDTGQSEQDASKLAERAELSRGDL